VTGARIVIAVVVLAAAAVVAWILLRPGELPRTGVPAPVTNATTQYLSR